MSDGSPILWKFSIVSIVFLSIISRVAGVILAQIMPVMAFAARFIDSKYASMTCCSSGFGISFSVASTIMPRVPSEPTKSWVKL